MEHNTEVLIITIDSELNEQVEQKQAIDYLQKAHEDQKERLQ